MSFLLILLRIPGQIFVDQDLELGLLGPLPHALGMSERLCTRAPTLLQFLDHSPDLVVLFQALGVLATHLVVGRLLVMEDVEILVLLRGLCRFKIC